MTAEAPTAPAVVPAGTRVQIRYTLLTPAERAPGLPDDTAATPYEVRATGILLADARVGERAAVRTAAGRRLTGALDVVEPADAHTFGRPHPALVRVVGEITRLREELAR